MPLSFVCPPPLPINPFSVGHITTTVETPYMHSSLPFPKAGFYYKCTVTGLESPLFGSIYNRLEILPPGGHTRPVDFKEIVGFNSSYCLSASAGLLLSVRVCVCVRVRLKGHFLAARVKAVWTTCMFLRRHRGLMVGEHEHSEVLL